MPIFQPSMTKSSSLSRARGGGDAGSQTPRCSATPIRCNCDDLSTEISHQHTVRTTTTTTTTHTHHTSRSIKKLGYVLSKLLDQVAWTRDGGIPQGCPLSMVFIAALGAPWCRHLEGLNGITQLKADNLKCTSYSVDILLAAARCSVSYVKVAGQERAARQRMTACRNENEGCLWAVKLDVRDLGGHLDVTLRALAGTSSSRVKMTTAQVLSVGALSMGFQRMLGMVCSKYLPGGLHAISVSSP